MIHGRQYTDLQARAHWIVRLVNKVTPEAGDRLVFYTVLFAIGFAAGMAVTGAFSN